MHPGVDWKAAPKTAQGWAVDADGGAHSFNSPNVAPFTDFWLAESEKAPSLGYGRLAREPDEAAVNSLRGSPAILLADRGTATLISIARPIDGQLQRDPFFPDRSDPRPKFTCPLSRLLGQVDCF